MSGECDLCGQHGHVEAKHCAFRGEPPAPPPHDLAALAAAMEAKAAECDACGNVYETYGAVRMEKQSRGRAAAYRECAAMVLAATPAPPPVRLCHTDGKPITAAGGICHCFKCWHG